MTILIKISYVLCTSFLGAIVIAYVLSLIVSHDQGWDELANFLIFLVIGGMTSAIASIISIRYMSKALLNKMALLSFILLVTVLSYFMIISK